MFRFLSIAALLFFAATSARAQSGPEEWVWGTSTGAGGLKSFAAMQGTMAYTGETGTNTWYDMEASSMVDSRGDWTQSSGVLTYGATTAAPTITVSIHAVTSAELRRASSTCNSKIQVLLDVDGSSGYSAVFASEINNQQEEAFCFGGTCFWYFQSMSGVTIKEIQDGGKIKSQVFSSCAPTTLLDVAAGDSHLVVMELE